MTAGGAAGSARLTVAPSERAALAAAAAVVAVSREHAPARGSAYLAVCGDVIGCLADGDVAGAARCLARLAAAARDGGGDDGGGDGAQGA